MKTYKIVYSMYGKDGSLLKDRGEMKVKNQMNDIGAKINLEKYLKKYHNSFDRMVVHSCKDVGIYDMGGDDISKIFPWL